MPARNLFGQLNRLLLDLGEASGDNLFVDGTKLESKANQYTFVWKKSVLKHEAGMQEELLERIGQISRKHQETLKFCKETAADDLKEAVLRLSEQMEAQGITPVHGRGHRKSRLQKDQEFWHPAWNGRPVMTSIKRFSGTKTAILRQILMQPFCI